MDRDRMSGTFMLFVPFLLGTVVELKAGKPSAVNETDRPTPLPYEDRSDRSGPEEEPKLREQRGTRNVGAGPRPVDAPAPTISIERAADRRGRRPVRYAPLGPPWLIGPPTCRSSGRGDLTTRVGDTGGQREAAAE